MLNLNEQPSLPRYELTTVGGETKSYDTLLLSYQLRTLDTEKDPAKIHTVINEIFEVDVDAFHALVILQDFTTFAEEHLEEPLKKVFGEKLYSAISMGSPPKNSKTSTPPST